MGVNIPSQRVRRFGGYVWLPTRASLAEIPDRKVRARVLAEVVAEMKQLAGELEAEQADTAIALLEQDGQPPKAVARWSGWSPANMHYRLSRRRGVPQKRDRDRVDRRIRRLADRVVA